MKIYTIEIQNCIEVRVKANTPEEARMKLIDNDDLWYEEFLETATIHNPIKEEEVTSND
jgi:hypothetical protein